MEKMKVHYYLNVKILRNDSQRKKKMLFLSLVESILLDTLESIDWIEFDDATAYSFGFKSIFVLDKFIYIL